MGFTLNQWSYYVDTQQMSHAPVTALLRELIAIPSINPAFAAGFPDWAGESSMVDFLEGRARSLGLETIRQNVAPGRDNLWVGLVPDSSKSQSHRKIVLAPHLDTVGGQQIHEGLFQPRLENGRLHGRGACDTKGCVAAMFHALECLATTQDRPQSTEVWFLGLVDEEKGQAGSRLVGASDWKADLVIVGEPTELNVVTAHKGLNYAIGRFRGRAAHGSRPHLGQNAILDAARVVQQMETVYAERLKAIQHPLLGSGTVNVGIIRGGAQANIVPDYCEIHIDRRTLPGETKASVLAELREMESNAGIQSSVEWDLGELERPAMESDSDLPLTRQLMDAAGVDQAVGVDFFCDAALIAQGGSPCIVFGPGSIDQAHTADEWIETKSLEDGAAILLNYLRQMD